MNEQRDTRGRGRPEIGRPIKLRLGDELEARVDEAREPGESVAAAVRRLLRERLDVAAPTA